MRGTDSAIPDSLVDGWYTLVEGSPKCPRCGGPMEYSVKDELHICAKCGATEAE